MKIMSFSDSEEKLSNLLRIDPTKLDHQTSESNTKNDITTIEINSSDSNTKNDTPTIENNSYIKENATSENTNDKEKKTSNRKRKKTICINNDIENNENIKNRKYDDYNIINTKHTANIIKSLMEHTSHRVSIIILPEKTPQHD